MIGTGEGQESGGDDVVIRGGKGREGVSMMRGEMEEIWRRYCNLKCIRNL